MVDFTRGPALRQIVRFSLPLLIGNLFQQLYTVVDSILLGRLVSPVALAAAGTVTPVTMLLLGVISGFTLGTSLMVAKATGKKEPETVRKLVESTFLADMLVVYGVHKEKGRHIGSCGLFVDIRLYFYIKLVARKS